MTIFQQLKKGFLNIKLGYKFLFVLIVFISGITVIGFTFLGALTIGDNSLNDLQKQASFSKVIDQIQIEALNARRYEKDFQLTNEPSNLQYFKDSFNNAQKQITLLRTLLKTTAEKQAINQVNNTLSEYQKAFTLAAESQIHVRNNEPDSLRGKLQQVGANISATLSCSSVVTAS